MCDSQRETRDKKVKHQDFWWLCYAIWSWKKDVFHDWNFFQFKVEDEDELSINRLIDDVTIIIIINPFDHRTDDEWIQCFFLIFFGKNSDDDGWLIWNKEKHSKWLIIFQFDHLTTNDLHYTLHYLHINDTHRIFVITKGKTINYKPFRSKNFNDDDVYSEKLKSKQQQQKTLKQQVDDFFCFWFS